MVPAVRSCEMQRCQLEVEALIDPLRLAAKACGYALAVHGSLKRDIDLIAVPWVEEAVAPEELLTVILETLEKETGRTPVISNESHDPHGPHCHCSHNPERKPHGRLAWAIQLSGRSPGPYIDLSVVSLRKD